MHVVAVSSNYLSRPGLDLGSDSKMSQAKGNQQIVDIPAPNSSMKSDPVKPHIPIT
uniref:Uncharacterized protein n=1 Tax=Arundo donax TaxID=35708 RepID=A0A0A8Y459_ARUDO